MLTVSERYAQNETLNTFPTISNFSSINFEEILHKNDLLLSLCKTTVIMFN